MNRTIITRREAHVRGLKRFYTGDACKRDHVCERFVSNGGCVMCINWGSPARKMQGPRGRNVGWPSQGLVFNVPGIMPEEIEAAFRYIEANGWHDVALLAVRNDPKLLERYVIPLTVQEQAELQSKLEQDRRTRRALLADSED